jgi:hypothetical protein
MALRHSNRIQYLLLLLLLLFLFHHNVLMSPIGVIVMVQFTLANGMRTGQAETLANFMETDQHTKEKQRIKHVVSARHSNRNLLLLLLLLHHNVLMSPIGVIVMVQYTLANGMRTSQTEPLVKSGETDQHTTEKQRIKHVVSVRLNCKAK